MGRYLIGQSESYTMTNATTHAIAPIVDYAEYERKVNNEF